jgi:predicted glycoside hydrolase/deacetylase ChbG (UPF0249 family)
MAVPRYLVVNADDLGLSSGVNEGIFRAHERGIVTSASLMVRRPFAGAAAVEAERRPRLSIGLHVDLREWEYVGESWRTRYDFVPGDDARAVEAEVARQLESFERLIGRPPSHLDSHQHVHLDEPLRSILLARADALGVAVRSCEPAIRYRGAFYGQSAKGHPCWESLSVAALVEQIRRLPEGWTELGCHPAARDDFDSSYRAERLRELETLCAPQVGVAIAAAGVVLASHAERLLGAAPPYAPPPAAGDLDEGSSRPAR